MGTAANYALASHSRASSSTGRLVKYFASHSGRVFAKKHF